MKLFIALGLFCIGCSVSWSALRVEVEPDKVQVGETFRLILTTDEPQSSGVPDLSPLQHDFTIVGTERGMSYSLENGQAHASTSWTVLLNANKQGKFTIPSVTVGKEKSTPALIEVREEPIATQHHAINPSEQDIMLKTEVTDEHPYINQQVIYTVKLLTRQRLIDAQYQPPTVEDALLISLGESRRYQTVYQGETYAVEEQQYAIFPQKSGHLRVHSPLFNAVVFDTVPRRVTVQGTDTPLKVNPIPASFVGKQWLPARDLRLTEQYDKLDTSFPEGSTIVRTVTLEAQGLPAQLLPTLDFTGSQFSAYPEKPQVDNVMQHQDIVGTIKVPVTYILNHSGRITIPALKVTWFNTSTRKQETTTLPERSLLIANGQGVQGGPQSSSPQQTATPVASPSSPASAAASVELAPTTRPTESGLSLAWWIALGFAAAWISTVALWWYRYKHPSNTVGKKQKALKQVRRACEANDSEKARTAVLHWAKIQWPEAELLHLTDISNRVREATLKKQLSVLAQALYSREQREHWRGELLWQAINAYRPSSKTGSKRRNTDLPPINPTLKKLAK